MKKKRTNRTQLREVGVVHEVGPHEVGQHEGPYEVGPHEDEEHGVADGVLLRVLAHLLLPPQPLQLMQ